MQRLRIMKKLTYIFLLLVTLANIRCNKDERFTLFDLTYVLNFELPAALNTVQTHFIEFNKVPTRWEALLIENNKTAEEISSIESHSGFLEVVLVPENLSFMREVFVEFNDGQNRLECFYTPNIPFNAGPQIQLVGTIADFKKQLMESAMNLRIGFRLREPSPSAMTCSLRLTFKAKS